MHVPHLFLIFWTPPPLFFFLISKQDGLPTQRPNVCQGAVSLSQAHPSVHTHLPAIRARTRVCAKQHSMTLWKQPRLAYAASACFLALLLTTLCPSALAATSCPGGHYLTVNSTCVECSAGYTYAPSSHCEVLREVLRGTNTQTHTHTDTQADAHTQTQMHRHTDTHTHTQRRTHMHLCSFFLFAPSFKCHPAVVVEPLPRSHVPVANTILIQGKRLKRHIVWCVVITCVSLPACLPACPPVFLFVVCRLTLLHTPLHRVQDCDAGTYNTQYGAASCRDCPAGHTCTDPSQRPTECPAASYASEGSETCQPCPAGFQCPQAGLAEPVPCSNGTYATANQVLVCA